MEVNKSWICSVIGLGKMHTCVSGWLRACCSGGDNVEMVLMKVLPIVVHWFDENTSCAVSKLRNRICFCCGVDMRNESLTSIY